VATFVLAFAGASLLTGGVGATRARDSLRPRVWEARQVLVVLIASSECRLSQDPTTRAAFAAIIASERRKAATTGARVTTVGIAVDQSARTGLDVLGQIGEFDEIIVGGGLLNLGAVRYVVGDLAARVAVPQVLIVSRDVGREGGVLTVGPDSVERRLIGTRAIARWSERITP
jgi:hypothetical protein